MTIVDQVTRRVLTKLGTSVRVAARYVQAKTEYQHKIVGKDARFLWGASRGWASPNFLIEELPQKGKRKLGQWRLTLDLPWLLKSLDISLIYFDEDAIVREAKIGSGDNYKAMVGKVEKAIEKIHDDLVKDIKSGKITSKASLDEVEDKWKQWINYHPYEEQVYFLEVMPEGAAPFTVNGKDFTLDVSWNAFEVYSPNSDFAQSDPYYSGYSQASPQGARTLYKILNADREALRNMAYNELSGWLKQNKIPVKYLQSSWH